MSTTTHWILQNNALLERRLTVVRTPEQRRYDSVSVILKRVSKHQTWHYARAEFSRIWLADPHSLDVTECPDVTQWCAGLSHGAFVAMVEPGDKEDKITLSVVQEGGLLRASMSKYAPQFFQPTR